MTNFSSLGAMIDCSRNGVMHPASIRDYIDILAKMGYTTLQLYTEDTYEVEGEPYFGYCRGRYSMAELKSLDEYAMSKGIEMIPCIQTLAHVNSIFRWQPYHSINDWDDIMLVGNDRTYQLIDRMFASLRQCFHTNKVHLGMDEAYMVGLGRYREANGIRDRFTIMLEHLNRVRELAQKYGFAPMIWNDMFNKLRRTSEYKTEDIKSMIPSDTQLVYWDYYRTDESEYLWRIKENKEICNNLMFAGGAWCWHGFTPHNRFSIAATKAGLSACVKEGIKDAFFTLWGDDGAECSRYSVLPVLAWAAALAQDENADEQKVRELFHSATGESYDDFLCLDLPDCIGTEGITVNNPTKYLLFSDPFMGYLDYTVDDSYSPYYAQTAKKLAEAKTRSANFGYLFHTSETLCDLLSLKCDLGRKTRQAYAEKQKDKLKYLAETEYPLCIEKLNVFADAFYTQWIKENKPHGFDVQDIRIGGLKERLIRCAKRLSDYANGIIDSIPELEEELLPFDDGKETGEAVSLNKWAFIATSNVTSFGC